MSLAAMLWASNLEIPSHRKLTLIIMGDHANTKNECWPSRSKLARRCSLSVGTIDRCIEDLETWGLIEKELREHDSGKKRSNKYTLRLDRVAPADAMDGSTTEPTPGDDEESVDETTASEAENPDRLQDESIPRSHGDAMGRSHGDATDGVTVKVANRTSHSEPSPLRPPSVSEPPSSSEAATPSSIANAADRTTPSLPEGEATGSAGQENAPADPNSDEFKREQFNQIVGYWQQANLIRFAGDQTAAWKYFREMPIVERLEAVTKAWHYLLGAKAAYAEWQSQDRKDRSRQAPKVATIKEYLGTRVYKLLGMPKEPPVPPKPTSASWIAELERMPLTPFDHCEKFFVEVGGDVWREWHRAFDRAGLLMKLTPRKVIGGDPNAGKTGRYFRAALPPREEDFPEQQNEQRGAA
jgi:hypothetical protein